MRDCIRIWRAHSRGGFIWALYIDMGRVKIDGIASSGQGCGYMMYTICVHGYTVCCISLLLFFCFLLSVFDFLWGT